MSLIAGRDATAEAVDEKAAVAAFNIFNLESIQAVRDAAEQTGAPVICQISHSAAAMYGWQALAEAVHVAARNSDARIVLHLDHGQSLEDVDRALQLGFTSIMYDGSAYPLETNIENTKAVIAACTNSGVQVEGEVGVVGGVSDLSNQPVSDVDDVCQFVTRTGCDLIAIAIGNAHGFYAEEPKLRFDTLADVAGKVSIPVVLHGASGIPNTDIRKSIALGVRKINYATELRAAFARGYRQNDDGSADPRPNLKAATAAMAAFCIEKIHLLGWPSEVRRHQPDRMDRVL